MTVTDERTPLAFDLDLFFGHPAHKKLQKQWNGRSPRGLYKTYSGGGQLDGNGNAILAASSYPSAGMRAYIRTVQIMDAQNPLAQSFTALNALPALGASPATVFNNNSVGVNATVSGGTVSAIAVNGTTTGLTSGTFFIPAGGTLTVTYTAAPTVTTARSLGPSGPNGSLSGSFGVFAGPEIPAYTASGVIIPVPPDPNDCIIPLAYGVPQFQMISDWSNWIDPGDRPFIICTGVQGTSGSLAFQILVNEFRMEDVELLHS